MLAEARARKGGASLGAEQLRLTQGLQHVAALLAEPAYREPILEGLVASIGGLDGILGRAAGCALLKTVHGDCTSIPNTQGIVKRQYVQGHPCQRWDCMHKP